MANRFAVNTPFTWNATAGNKWSTTSGGAGGSAAPTSSDAVILDAASGSGAITTSGATSCLTLVGTAFTGSLVVVDDLSIFGNTCTFGAGMTVLAGGSIGTIIFDGGTVALTSNGVTIEVSLVVDGAAVTLQDNLTLFRAVGDKPTFLVASGGGTWNFNGKTVSCQGLNTQSNGGTLTFGSATLTVTDGNNFTVDAGTTINADTGTIVMEGGIFTGAGKTYNDFRHSGGGNQFILGGNTFADLDLSVAGSFSAVFEAGTTTTADTFEAENCSLVSTSGGVIWTLSVASGTVEVTGCTIQDSTATGGADFVAKSSYNLGNNTGWFFGSAWIFKGGPF